MSILITLIYIAVHLAEKAWLPLQPPIPFPSPDRRHDDEGEDYREGYPENDNMEFHFHDQDELYHHEPAMGHTSNMPPPTGHGHRHQHAEL